MTASTSASVTAFSIAAFCSASALAAPGDDDVAGAITLIERAATDPKFCFADAQGIAIVPGMFSLVIGVGGRSGTGVLVLRRGGDWSNPSFVRYAAGNLGLELSFQSAAVIQVFATTESLARLVEGKPDITASVGASSAAGARGVSPNTLGTFGGDVRSYSYSKWGGSFGVKFEGTTVVVLDRRNRRFYEGTATREFDAPTPATPTEAQALLTALKQAAEARGPCRVDAAPDPSS